MFMEVFNKRATTLCTSLTFAEARPAILSKWRLIRCFLNAAASFHLARALVLTSVFCVGAGLSHAQDFPAKPLRFVVPTTPGSTGDLVARVMGIEMARVIGQPVIVDNKPGANQIIGLENVARQSPADGYTIGIVGIDGMALLPLTTKELRFDPLKDLTMVLGIAEARYVLVSPVAKPWKAFNELVAHAKANPGKLNYGSSVHQVRFPVMMLMQELGLDMLHIPYSGGRPYEQALATGTLDLGILTEGSASRAGNDFNLLATTGTQRMAARPNAPMFAEVGFPQIKGPAYGMSVRTGTPRTIVDKLAAAAGTALDRPEAKGAMEKLFLRVTNEKPDAVTRSTLETFRFYADFAKKVNLKPE